LPERLPSGAIGGFKRADVKRHVRPSLRGRN
jgi:hypothetical protein